MIEPIPHTPLEPGNTDVSTGGPFNLKRFSSMHEFVHLQKH
jgi:hypothetical protein